MSPIKVADVKDEYAKDPKLREADVQAIREWLQKQPHLPEVTELQLIQCLQSCYFSVERAKATIDNFFTVKTHFPECFSNLTLSWAPLKDTLNVSVFSFLSKKTAENHSVIYCKIIDGDASKYIFAEQLKTFDMVVTLWLRQHGTMEGFHIVTDMRDVCFGHVAKLNIMVMKKFMFYLQEAMPVRLKGLHFINVVSFMDKILAIMKPFMKKELLDMLFIHTDSTDSLYKMVPKECLPKDLGGADDTVANLHARMIKELGENGDLFQADEQQRVDESKRPGKPKNDSDIFGVEGSFKKLDID